MSRGSVLLTLKFRSNPEMLCVVRGALGPLTETLGLSPEATRAVVLAVDEALTNVIRHAYLGQTDKPIEVTFRRCQARGDEGWRDALEIELEDHGIPAKAEEMQGRSLDEVRPGGLGLHFIRENMDSVKFRYEGGKNHLHLIKFLEPAIPRQDS
jgi:anti-sigma regulatory factor (Ser/Thr protein kinase)